MQESKDAISRAEVAAALYLISPLFVFFAFFIRLEIAVPACALIAWQAAEIIRRASWREPLNRRWMYFFFLTLAILWVWLSVGTRIENFDWIKHYSVVNFLDRHAWPSHANVGGLGDSVIRYSLGWYLIPAAVLKLTNADVQTFVLATWSVLGVFLPLLLLTARISWNDAQSDNCGAVGIHSVRRGGFYRYTSYLAPRRAAFSHRMVGVLDRIYVKHHGFVLGAAARTLRMARRCTAHAKSARYFIAAVFDFARGGCRVVVAFQCRGAGAVFTGPALALRPEGDAARLAADRVHAAASHTAGSLPTGQVRVHSCGVYHCHSVYNRAPRLLYLEILFGFSADRSGFGARDPFLWKPKEHGFLVAAALALCLIPLYRVGIYNDFAMRASMPALAVLSILCAKAYAQAPTRYSRAMLVVLMLALPTSAAEIYRGFMPGPSIRADATFDDPWAEKYLRQYFAPLPVWVVR